MIIIKLLGYASSLLDPEPSQRAFDKIVEVCEQYGVLERVVITQHQMLSTLFGGPESSWRQPERYVTTFTTRELTYAFPSSPHSEKRQGTVTREVNDLGLPGYRAVTERREFPPCGEGIGKLIIMYIPTAGLTVFDPQDNSPLTGDLLVTLTELLAPLTQRTLEFFQGYLT
ncbi:hypothetical protein HYW21_00225 [Candidatus Woesearchaeota archaeon]|nr:hypothetical protein [Candidatus Woesearchaeota archaeon]